MTFIVLLIVMFSLCVNVQFRVKGNWHTWIDYEKFHQLVSGFVNCESEFALPTNCGRTFGALL